MQAFNAAFRAYNRSASKERRYAISIAMDVGVTLWVVSHADVTPGSGTVLAGELESLSVVSQTLHPEEGRAEIGTLSFSAIDYAQSLSDELQDQLQASGHGAIGKAVELYVGDARLAFGDYVLRTTQILDRVTSSRAGTKYTFRCRDAQRFLRTDIFTPVETTLTAAISDTDTTISVISTAAFIGVNHGTSWSDAPSTDGVIYIQIEDEIIRTLAADAAATQFTNCVRGVLGTRAAAHDTDENAAIEPDAGEKVVEVVYLELPAPKLVGAIETGVLWNQSGDTLPAHWHAAAPAAFVSEAEHEAIGLDIWDPADDTEGVIFRFVNPGPTDAKQFVEQSVLAPLGLYQPVRADGSLGLRRASRIVEGVAAVRTLTDDDILSPPDLEYDGSGIINELEVRWNFVGTNATRRVVIPNSGSVSRWGAAPRHTVEAPGLHGSRHSRAVVTDLVTQIFDRHSGPPIVTKLQIHGSHSDLEVGDIVRVVTTSARDWTGTTVALDRPFEIQGMREDWIRNKITLDLVASSEPSDAIAPLSEDEGIPDAWYSSAGTNLAGVAGVTDAGSHLLIGAGAALTGNASLTASGAIYYALKDVILDAGVTRAWTHNLQLRVLGVLTINGTLTGAGAGITGVADTVDESPIPFYPTVERPVDFAFQEGTPGGFGTTQAGGGLVERMRREEEGSGYNGFVQSIEAPLTRGTWDVLPNFDLRWDGTKVAGLPGDLRGTSGGPGGLRYYSDTKPAPNVEQVNRGGTGGAGGGGIAIVARGIAFGASGKIITDGADGSVGAYDAGDDFPAHAGGGAGGAPGGMLLAIDGLLNPVPTSIGGNIQAIYGDTPDPSGAFERLTEPLYTEKQFWGTTIPEDRLSFFESSTSGRDAAFAAVRVQYMPPIGTASQDFDRNNRTVPGPSALGATAAVDAIIWTCTAGTPSGDWDDIEYWLAESNDRSGATLVESRRGEQYYHGTDPGVTLYGWIRARRGDQVSAWHPTSSTGGVSATALRVGDLDIEFARELADAFAAESIASDVAVLRNWTLSDNASGGSLDVTTDAASVMHPNVISSNGEMWARHVRSVPFDPSGMYRVVVFARRFSGTPTGAMWLGLVAQTAAGVDIHPDGTLPGGSSFRGHWAVNGVPCTSLSATEYTALVAYVSGVGASVGTDATSGQAAPITAPIVMHPDTRRIRPSLLINNAVPDPSPSQVVRVAAVIIEKVEAPFTGATDPRLTDARDDLDNARVVTSNAGQSGTTQTWPSDSAGDGPSGNPSVVLTARFYRDGTQIATQPVTFALTSATHVINRTIGTATGEAVTTSTTGNGSGFVSVEVTHTASNQRVTLTAYWIDNAAIASGGGSISK